MKKFGLVAAALTVVAAVACGDRRDETTRGNTPNDTVGTGGEARETTTGADTRNDRASNDLQRWAQDITMHNTAEIELGKMASERASNAQVKQFGQMMVRDHTMAGNELKQIVSGHIQVQEQMDEKHRDLAQKLRGMQGIEFDREYMDAMVDGHQEVKGMLEDRARDAKNTGTSGTTGNNNASNAQFESGVNQWAAKTLPTVEQHLMRAEQLKDTLQNSSRTTQNNTGTNRNRTENNTGANRNSSQTNTGTNRNRPQ
jgi:putative membrane protein